MARSKTFEKNLAATLVRYEAAMAIASPQKQADRLAKLRLFVGEELYRKAVSRYESQKWFAGSPYKNGKAKGFGGGGGEFVEAYRP